MKTLILTVAVGDTFERFAREFTYPAMRRYAANIGADFVQWNQTHVKITTSYWGGLMWAREQRYDKVLYLDADVLVTDGASNIFDLPCKP